MKRSEINAAGEPFDLRKYCAYRLAMIVADIRKDVTNMFATEHLDVSLTEWQVLSVVNQFSPTTTSQIIEHSSADAVKISRTLTKLQAKRLIERRAMQNDRRAHFISVTPEGAALAHRLGELSTRMEAAWLARLTPDERAALLRILAKLEAPL